MYLAPAFAASLVSLIRPDQMSSVETLILLGSPSTPELMATLQEKLPKTAHLYDGYGTIETHGFIAIPDRNAPLKCNGWVMTFMYYKIIDDQGQELGPNQSGELCVKGDCVIKVAPEEVERVIGSLPGVHECVVCASDNGPVAAVVLEPSADVTREQIHKAVDSTLSDPKRLHGGIAFVTSLPHTHSGKLKRNECSKLIADLLKSGEF